MQIVFVPRDNGPERLVTEAELVFDADGPLSGLKLVGFSLWRSADGELYVTFPARSFGAGPERKYFDYLRSVEGSAEPVRRLKEAILTRFREASPDDSAAELTEHRYSPGRK